MIRHWVWALRRELWENRWLYVAPLCLGASIIAGFSVYAFHLPSQMAALDAAGQRKAIVDPYEAVAGLMMIAGLLVGVIYSVDALYAERRDRSVLLWKSLPVSDVMTVLAKICVPVLLLPLTIWVITVVVHLAMMLISSAVLIANGQSATIVWAQVRLVSNSLSLGYHLVALHGLFAAPLYGWLLLMSAWAPRAPFIWAFLPPVGMVFLERVALGTTRFANLLLSRLSGPDTAKPPAGGSFMDSMAMLPLSQFLTTPALWTGLAFTALLVAGMVRLRRSAHPI